MRKNGKPQRKAQKASVMLYPEQLAAMRAVANDRAFVNGGRADVSSMVREAVDEWMGRHRKEGRG